MVDLSSLNCCVKEKNYAFLEFRCIEEASNCMALDGVQFMDTFLKVKQNIIFNHNILLNFDLTCFFWNSNPCFDFEKPSADMSI